MKKNMMRAKRKRIKIIIIFVKIKLILNLNRPSMATPCIKYSILLIFNYREEIESF